MKSTPTRLVAASAAATFTLLAPGQPGMAATDHTPPRPVTAVKATTTETTARLTWTNPRAKDLAAVVVRRKVGARAPATPKAGVRVTRLQTPRHAVTDRDLRAETTYSYAIFAVDRHGNFSRRAVTHVTTKLDTTPPPPVSGLGATSDGSTINLSWTRVDDRDVDHIVVVRSEGIVAPTNIDEGISLPANAVGYDDHVGVGATAFSYAVYTVDKRGNAAAVTITAATTGDDIRPDAPTVTGAVRHPDRISLTWGYALDDTDSLGVMIRRSSIDADGDGLPEPPKRPHRGRFIAVVPIDGPDSMTFVDDAVKSTGGYAYSVFSYDRAGNFSPLTSTNQAVFQTLN
jgi:hypothetical protein